MPDYDIKDWALPDDDTPDVTDLVEAMIKLGKEAPPDGLWLDLGCGKERQEGFIGMDLEPQDDQTMTVDLFDVWGEPNEYCPDGPGWHIGDTKGLLPAPSGFLEANTVSYVYSSHFIEHIPTNYGWKDFWEELYRICKPGAILVMIYPYGTSSGAYQDPTHRQVITIERFAYFSKKWRDANLSGSKAYAQVDFRHKHVPWFVWDEEFVGLSDKAKEYHLKHTFNAVREGVVFLECVK